MAETDKARHLAAIQLIQLIEAVAKIPDVYDQTTSALDVVDSIANYCKLECSLQPPTSSASSAGTPPETSVP